MSKPTRITQNFAIPEARSLEKMFPKNAYSEKSMLYLQHVYLISFELCKDRLKKSKFVLTENEYKSRES